MRRIYDVIKCGGKYENDSTIITAIERNAGEYIVSYSGIGDVDIDAVLWGQSYITTVKKQGEKWIDMRDGTMFNTLKQALKAIAWGTEYARRSLGAYDEYTLREMKREGIVFYVKWHWSKEVQ